VRRAPVPGVDPSVYVRAIPLLARNPHIIVLPLLMAVVGVLIGQVMAPYGGGVLTVAAGGIASLIVLLLQMFGVGAACIIADDAWRHGRASFDRGWEEARRRAGDNIMAAVGFSLLLGVAQYVGVMVGAIALLLVAAVFYFLIWTLPAAAVGGIPGGAAIQVSIDRVRSAPLAAAVAAIVSLAVMLAVGWRLPLLIDEWLFAYVPFTPIGIALVAALFQAIALGYIALILTKTYTDSAFGR
jgi:hypothetical protein